MKLNHTCLAFMALSIFCALFLRSADRAFATSAAAVENSTPQAGEFQGVQVAAAVRRGVVVRGPRGRRVFVYRGRRVEVIRRPAFVWPPGYAYRRWRAHEFLPLAFVAAPFFFLEYEALGLQPPPPGYHWVRYGPDLVLVNDGTREIDDIVYDAIEDE